MDKKLHVFDTTLRDGMQGLELIGDGSARPGLQLQELYDQWTASEAVAEALAGAAEEHQAQERDPNWTAVQRVLHGLAQQVLAHRRTLREQISAAGGELNA